MSDDYDVIVNYDSMTAEQIAGRIHGDLIELSNRFANTSAGQIANLFLRQLSDFEAAFHTALLLFRP